MPPSPPLSLPGVFPKVPGSNIPDLLSHGGCGCGHVFERIIKCCLRLYVSAYRANVVCQDMNSQSDVIQASSRTPTTLEARSFVHIVPFAPRRFVERTRVPVIEPTQRGQPYRCLKVSVWLLLHIASHCLVSVSDIRTSGFPFDLLAARWVRAFGK